MVGMDLARHLRSWSAAELTRLLENRPDLLPASDRGLDAVARKAGTVTSLGRVLVGADVGMLVVAEALVAIHPATVTEIDTLLGTDDPLAVIDAIERLRHRGVVVVDDGIIHPVGALPDLLHRPLRLGPSFEELADQLQPGVLERLAADTRAEGGQRSPTIRAVARRLRDPAVLAGLIDDAPQEVHELLADLSASRSPAISLPAGHAYRTPSADDPMGWLLRRGLVVAVNERGAELPRELVIATHADGLAAGAALRPIELEPVPGIDPDLVAGTAADQANRAIDGAEALLRLAARREISVRRSGGIGPRELTRLGRLVGLDAIAVTRLLELLAAARLVRVDGTTLAEHDLADRWWAISRPRRYLALVRAWVGADHFLSRGLPDGQVDRGDEPAGDGARAKAGSTSAGAGPVALGASEPVAATAAARAVAVETMSRLDRGLAWDPDQLAAAVVWQAPNLWGPGEPPPEQLVAWTVAEAELLGLVAGDTGTALLRALAGGDEAALEAAATELVADDQRTIVLQGDLTALSLGPLDPSVAGPLEQMTEREATSEATTPTFRFTEASVRRAFDAGWTTESLTEFLDQHALAGVPQPLEYLVADVARRHGSIKVQAASTVIVTDDDVGAVEIATNRRTSGLALKLIAPTVLISPLDPVAVTEGLRAAGFSPVLQGDTVEVGASRGRSSASSDDLDPVGGLPADWTGPALPVGPFPDEVADAVAALLGDGAGLDPIDEITALLGPADDQDGQHPTTTGPGSAGRSGDADRDIDTDANTLVSQLATLWGRPVRLRSAGTSGAGEVTGVVVGLGSAVSVLTTTGVVEVPTTSVLSVDHLDQV